MSGFKTSPIPSKLSSAIKTAIGLIFLFPLFLAKMPFSSESFAPASGCRLRAEKPLSSVPENFLSSDSVSPRARIIFRLVSRRQLFPFSTRSIVKVEIPLCEPVRLCSGRVFRGRFSGAHISAQDPASRRSRYFPGMGNSGKYCKNNSTSRKNCQHLFSFIYN